MCRVTKTEENNCVFHSLGLETGSFLLSGKKQHHSARLVAANVKARVCEHPSESERMREHAAKHTEHERLNSVLLSAARCLQRQANRGERDGLKRPRPSQELKSRSGSAPPGLKVRLFP